MMSDIISNHYNNLNILMVAIEQLSSTNKWHYTIKGTQYM